MSLYKNSGVPKRHNQFRPIDNKNEQWQTHYDFFKEKIEDGGIFVLFGDRGQGKTQLSCSVIGFLTTKLEKSALYKKAQDIFLEIRAGMKGQDYKTEVSSIEDFIRPYLLVIDAYEVRGETDFENRMMDHIVDKRYDGLKATIIITNDKKENISKSLGSSIVSRMVESGGALELKDCNFRANKDIPNTKGP